MSREVPVDPQVLAQIAPDTTRVFLGGMRTPGPKQRAWLHQLLSELGPIDRTIMHLHLQGTPQRAIAAQVGLTQPGVCWRLKAAQRRLRLLARLPRPPVTLDEVRAALVAAKGPDGQLLTPLPRDPEILVLAQRMPLIVVARELGWAETDPGRRVRAMRVMVRPEATRVATLIALLLEQVEVNFSLFRKPRSDVGRRRLYRVAPSDGNEEVEGSSRSENLAYADSGG